MDETYEDTYRPKTANHIPQQEQLDETAYQEPGTKTPTNTAKRNPNGNLHRKPNTRKVKCNPNRNLHSKKKLDTIHQKSHKVCEKINTLNNIKGREGGN